MFYLLSLRIFLISNDNPWLRKVEHPLIFVKYFNQVDNFFHFMDLLHLWDRRIDGECDQHGHCSNLTRALLLCPWEKYFREIFSVGGFSQQF